MLKAAVFNIRHLNSNREDFFAFFFFFALYCRKDWSKFNALTSASPILSSGIYQNKVEVSTPPPTPLQKHPPYYILPSPLQIGQAPVFRILHIYVYFLWPLPPKNWWTFIMLTFFISFFNFNINPNLSFKSN